MSADTILLVEDNPDDEALTLRAMRRSGVCNHVVVARDGVEALDYLFARGAWADRNAAVLPRLVLLDLHLPRLDGISVLQHLRGDARTRRLPVVMLTSSGEDGDLVASYDSGANGYVRKPVAFGDLAEAVRALGLYWMLLNEVSPPTGPEVA